MNNMNIKQVKTIVGEVISNKMNKTVVVAVVVKTAHPVYGKFVKKTTKYYAHADEKLEIGQLVKIRQTRPISKLKRWVVEEIIEKGAA